MAVEELLSVTSGCIASKHSMTGLWQTDTMRQPHTDNVPLTVLMLMETIAPIIADGQVQKSRPTTKDRGGIKDEFYMEDRH